ncbi:hypothetical protein CO675_00110 [Bradyrhizobium sp. C9]|nr:hypothetical protein CO675_00110 [Bradyrhizobium sp. C9]
MDVGIESGLGDTGQISYHRRIIRFGTDRDRSVKPPTQIGLKITYSRIRITTAVQPADVRNTVARDGI